MTVKLTAWRKTFSLKVSICLGNQEIVRNVKIIEDYLRMFLTITVFQSRMFLVITVFQSRMFLVITVFQSRIATHTTPNIHIVQNIINTFNLLLPLNRKTQRLMIIPYHQCVFYCCITSPNFTKLIINTRPLKGTSAHRNFKFPTISNNNMADVQACEVKWRVEIPRKSRYCVQLAPFYVP